LRIRLNLVCKLHPTTKSLYPNRGNDYRGIFAAEKFSSCFLAQLFQKKHAIKLIGDKLNFPVVYHFHERIEIMLQIINKQAFNGKISYKTEKV
jgi:hypothetical protein